MFKHQEVYLEAYSPVGLNISRILRVYLGAWSPGGWKEPSCVTGHIYQRMSGSVPDNLPGTVRVSQPRGVLGNSVWSVQVTILVVYNQVNLEYT